MPIPDRLLDEIDRLDPLPVTIQELVTRLGEEMISVREIVAVLEYDQAVAATLLRVANSAAYGSRFPLYDVRSAVTRLGLDQILTIVLGAHYRNLSVPAELYDLSEDDLWLHGAVASLAAREISNRTPAQVPPIASTAALVHDIGKLVLVRYVDADLERIREVVHHEEVTFVEAERILFGFDHAQVGAAMARSWSFPAQVEEAIASHHDAPLDDPTPLLDTVILSNVVAKHVGVGLGAEGLNLRVDTTGSAGRLGIDFDDFARICSDVLTRMTGLPRQTAA